MGTSIGIGSIPRSGWIASFVFGALSLPWGYAVRLWPLDWSFGPTDEDPLAMSKLEKLLRIPVRKPPVFDRKSDAELGILDGPTPTVPSDPELERHLSELQDGEDAADASDVSGLTPTPFQKLASTELAAAVAARSPSSPSKVRLRVFVHAVAFVNVVTRRVTQSPSGLSPPAIKQR